MLGPGYVLIGADQHESSLVSLSTAGDVSRMTLNGTLSDFAADSSVETTFVRSIERQQRQAATELFVDVLA